MASLVLTPTQRAVAEAPEQRLLVTGGPGTGKTTTALAFARASLSGAGPNQQALFLTFSRTAMAQVLRRAPSVLGGAPERVEVMTFHGFAYRLICGFGRYAGLGTGPFEIDSGARARLFGQTEALLSFDDLLPLALQLLGSRRIVDLVTARWPVVICDEFQDTDDLQWQLLQIIAENSRALLLADPNQLIYTFLRNRGVGERRLAIARQWVARSVELPPASHRDPSGVIPAMASDIRQRQFSTEAVHRAIETGRLRVRTQIDDALLPSVLPEELLRLSGAGARSIGVFVHTNDAVEALSAALVLTGIDHTIVGVDAAHAEGVAALAEYIGFGVGIRSREQARRALALFMTACTRRNVPQLASQLAFGGLPGDAECRLHAAEERVQAAAKQSAYSVLNAVSEVWGAIGWGSGQRIWRRAVADLWTTARPSDATSASQDFARALLIATARRRPSVLFELVPGGVSPVQLMNLHQTKGREMDAVVLVYRGGDYFGSEREPFVDGSKLLYVSLTRARQGVVVLLPTRPHDLVRPLGRLGTPG